MEMYHATYRPLLPSILEQGLDNRGKQRNWNDSKAGVVYLAITPEVAESYAECAESEHIPDEWFDNIVILRVDLSQLNPDQLFIDQNNQTEDGSTWEYHGTIPATALSLLE